MTSSHATDLGDWVINGKEPPLIWSIGNGPGRGSK